MEMTERMRFAQSGDPDGGLDRSGNSVIDHPLQSPTISAKHKDRMGSSLPAGCGGGGGGGGEPAN